MTKRRRGREASGPLLDWIQEKARQKWTAKQIDDFFQQMKKDELRRTTFMRNLQVTKFPKIYTLRRIVSDMTIPDTSGTWSPADKDTNPEDLRILLDVLAWVTLDTKGEDNPDESRDRLDTQNCQSSTACMESHHLACCSALHAG